MSVATVFFDVIRSGVSSGTVVSKIVPTTVTSADLYLYAAMAYLTKYPFPAADDVTPGMLADDPKFFVMIGHKIADRNDMSTPILDALRSAARVWVIYGTADMPPVLTARRAWMQAVAGPVSAKFSFRVFADGRAQTLAVHPDRIDGFEVATPGRVIEIVNDVMAGSYFLSRHRVKRYRVNGEPLTSKTLAGMMLDDVFTGDALHVTAESV